MLEPFFPHALRNLPTLSFFSALDLSQLESSRVEIKQTSLKAEQKRVFKDVEKSQF